MNELMNNDELNPSEESKPFEIRDNSKRAKTLLIVFWILIALVFIGLFTGYNELQILQKLQVGEYVSDQEIETSDLVQAIMGFSQFGLYIISIIVFLNWFRRAYGNLHRLGIEYVKHQESMAVWAWGIPIVWFYRPVQIMNEIWTETQDQIKKLDASHIITNGDLIIGVWWALFVISNFIGRYILKTAFKEDTIEEIITGTEAMLISDLIQIPEALMVVLIVRKLSSLEAKLANEIVKSGGKVVYDL